MMKNREYHDDDEDEDEQYDHGDDDNDDDDHDDGHDDPDDNDDDDTDGDEYEFTSDYGDDDEENHPPKLIIYADYSARSEFSLDFQYVSTFDERHVNNDSITLANQPQMNHMT